MTSTFGSLIAEVAMNAGMAWHGVCTGGTTSTIVDTTYRTQEADDHWLYGSVVITKTTDGFAPIDQYAFVSDFVGSTGTITVPPAEVFSSAPQASDEYVVIDPRLPLAIIKNKVNLALENLKRIVVDTATVTLADNDTEYTLVADAAMDLRKVWVSTETGTDNNEWREVDGWSLQYSATVGDPPKLIIPIYYAVAGYTLKYEYAYPHPTLTQGISKLDETIQDEEVTYPATLDCLVWMKQQHKTDDFDQAISHWQGKVQELELTKAKRHHPRTGKKFSVTQRHSWHGYPGDRTPR